MKTIHDALRAAGYSHMEPTIESLRECFLDYVDAGVYENLNVDDAIEQIASGEITEADMIYNLSRRNRNAES